MARPMKGLGNSLIFTLALLFGTHAGYSQDSSGSAADQWPQWLRDAMSQESLRLRDSKVDFGDGLVKSRLAGKPRAAPQAIDGGWYVAMDIGTAAPLECWLFTQEVDPAAVASSIADASIQSSVQANGPLNERTLYHVDAGAFDGAPYLALEWIYGVGEPPNVLAGLAKVRTAVVDDITVSCAHNALGYRETFALAFEQFVREADIFGGADRVYYEEIIVQKIGEQPIGVTRARYALDEEGDTEIRTTESSLVPVDSATLTVSDTWYVAYSRPDGTLINQHVAQSQNGDLTMQLSLGPTEDGLWLVSGSLQGKEISHEFGADAEPISELGQMFAVQELLASEDHDSRSLQVWVPSADPTQFLDAQVALVPGGREQGRADLSMGPLTVAAEFDRFGSLRHGRVQTGPSEMIMERVWVNGTPP
jgi:hypothetical protein